MKRFVVAALGSSLLFASATLAQKDQPGSKDYPGINRMPGVFIYRYVYSDFDAANFPVMKDNKEVPERVEGKYYLIQYNPMKDAQEASALQIVRNHQAAAKVAGWQVLVDHPGSGWHETTLRLNKGGKDVWMAIRARRGGYELVVVERTAMEQDLTMIDAAGMASGLGANGSVALYGLYFDTGKSDLKPESDPTLTEIAKLLNSNPDLKLLVVGHTDMVGDAAANMTLSSARAQSVVKALTTKHGVAPARLKPFGAGPYAPVATNKTDEGRAKNRRVELVDVALK